MVIYPWIPHRQAEVALLWLFQQNRLWPLPEKERHKWTTVEASHQPQKLKSTKKENPNMHEQGTFNKAKSTHHFEKTRKNLCTSVEAMAFG